MTSTENRCNYLPGKVGLGQVSLRFAYVQTCNRDVETLQISTSTMLDYIILPASIVYSTRRHSQSALA